MRPNENPSVGMLHSVGALMDTSFLRAAMADADGPAHAGIAPASFFRRLLDWAMAAFARVSRTAR